MIELKMPALSPTMEKGTLARWLVSPGDSVKPGDLIAEIETDKATMELEAVDEGRVDALLVAEGTDDIPVGTPIGTLVGADDPVEASPAAAAAPPSEPPRTEGPEPVATDGGEVGQAQPAPDADPDEDAGPVAAPVEDARATPLAARFAAARGIDLSSRRGDDRIRITDLVPRRVETPVPAAASDPAATALPGERAPDDAPRPDNPETRVRLTGMRKTIARRLTQAKQEAPHIYLTVDVRIDALLALRAELNAALAAREIKLSVNDFMIKGLAMALAAEPACNVRYTPDALIRYARADVAVAVSVPDGLVTPVVTGADRRSLSAIAVAMRDLAGRARSGNLDPQDYAGGTASLSNLGMFGIDQFAAVLNPPQAVILAVGAGRSRPWDIDGTIGLATIVTVTGSFDHRAIDGADAARFLSAFRSAIERPLDLTV